MQNITMLKGLSWDSCEDWELDSRWTPDLPCAECPQSAALDCADFYKNKEEAQRPVTAEHCTICAFLSLSLFPSFFLSFFLPAQLWEGDFFPQQSEKEIQVRLPTAQLLPGDMSTLHNRWAVWG